MPMERPDGWYWPRIISGPAMEPSANPPPRSRMPGPGADAFAPEKHMMSLLKAPQPGHADVAGTQSPTNSFRFPTMSNAPRADTQALREPVAATVKELAVL